MFFSPSLHSLPNLSFTKRENSFPVFSSNCFCPNPNSYSLPANYSLQNILICGKVRASFRKAGLAGVASIFQPYFLRKVELERKTKGKQKSTKQYPVHLCKIKDRTGINICILEVSEKGSKCH